MRRVLTVILGLTLASTYAYADDASAQYTKMCASCHGADGKGNDKKATALKVELKKLDLTQATGSEADLKTIIQKGQNKMPAYEKKLDDAAATAMAAYVAKFKSSSSSTSTTSTTTTTTTTTTTKPDTTTTTTTKPDTTATTTTTTTTTPPVDDKAAAKAAAKAEKAAKSKYGTLCKSCHGKDGKGVAAKATKLGVELGQLDLTASTMTHDQILEIVLHGQGKMPGYEKKVKEKDREAFVAYVLKLMGKK